MDAQYDLVIIGGGPAGTAAAVYAARKRIKSAMLVAEFGGQSVVSPDIQNWVGTVSISGNELAESFKKHVQAYAGSSLTVETGKKVTKVEKERGVFVVHAEDGSSFTTKTVLIATGADRRRLQVPGAEEFDNKGLTYCATCDGPLFDGQDVAVIGGGNAGFETAAQLLAYAKSVTLLHRGDAYKADQITVDKVLEHDNMAGILNADTQEIYGDAFVQGLKYTVGGSDQVQRLAVTGVFVEIGLVPATSFVEDFLELDDYKRIVIDPWTQRTTTDGVWAAGDCSNVRYHQNNIAAGDAVKALEDVYVWLTRHK